MALSDPILDRLDSQRREEVAPGITGALSCLRDPDVTDAQRAAWAETYMRTALDRVADLDRRIDDRVWSLLTRAVAA